MASTIPAEFAPLLTVERTIILPISTLSAMYFVYGVYVLLFGTYLYIMRNCERTQTLDKDRAAATNRFYPWLATVLFVLSTLFVVVDTILYVDDSIIFLNTVKTGDYPSLSRYWTPASDLRRVALDGLENLIPVLLNITVDWMLIHRCYTIWSASKRIGVPLIVGSVIVNLLGLISVIMMIVGLVQEGVGRLHAQGNLINFVYAIGSIVINSILTLLTAGRIWWMHRQVRAHGAHTSDKFVQSVYRIIIESGIIYPLLQVAVLVSVNTSDAITFPYYFYPVTTLSAGIAPTLIMVRGKLGKNIESLQTGVAVSDIQFNDQPTTTATSVHDRSLNITLTGGAVDPREEEVKEFV